MEAVRLVQFGETLASRHLGRQVRAVLAEALQRHGRIVVEMAGVEVAAPGFLDEAFAKLVHDGVRGTIELRHAPHGAEHLVRRLVARRKAMAAGGRAR